MRNFPLTVPFTELAARLIQSISCDVRVLFVCEYAPANDAITMLTAAQN